MESISVVAALLVVAVIGAGVTIWMLRRVAKHWHQAVPATKLAAIVIAALLTFGALGALLGLITAFGAVGGESVDPSQKARILGEGISTAMNYIAFSLMVWIPTMVAAFVLTRRGRPNAK